MRSNKCDYLEQGFERCGPDRDGPMTVDTWEAMERDRRTGINAEPTDGFRDGVRDAYRLFPHDYIPNGKG